MKRFLKKYKTLPKLGKIALSLSFIVGFTNILILIAWVVFNLDGIPWENFAAACLGSFMFNVYRNEYQI